MRSALIRDVAQAELTTDAPLIAALDVGVSKTVCLAARRDPILDMHPERPLRVLGVGVETAPAIASGKPADFDACARAIRIAIDNAAAMAGAPIERVITSYAGPGLSARTVRAHVRIRSGSVSVRDLDAVLAAAEQSAPQPGRAVLHVEPLRYFVDDGEPLPDPCGFQGGKLSVEACVVSAPREAIEALRACIRAGGVEVEDIIAAPYAAAAAVLTEAERDEGVLLIDLGAGSVGLAYYAPEGLALMEALPLGGVRLTRDLAAKLETTFAAAERVKLHFGAVGLGFDRREAVQAPKLGLDGRLEAATTLRGVIADTLRPRLTDMLLMVRQQLAREGLSGVGGPGRAVLVGGGAQIPGVRDLAADVLGMPVRIGRLGDLCGFDHGEAGPGFAVAAGLLRHRFDNPDLGDVETSFQPSLAGVAAMMRGAGGDLVAWFREHF
jgi:cell division protein FtsA